MSGKPAVEASLFVNDPRYDAYREGLERAREVALRRLLRRNQPFETMTRLAGEISAIDFALGLPAELLESDPQTTPNP